MLVGLTGRLKVINESLLSIYFSGVQKYLLTKVSRVRAQNKARLNNSLHILTFDIFMVDRAVLFERLFDWNGAQEGGKGAKTCLWGFFSGCKKPLGGDENLPWKDKYEDNATRHKFSRALFTLEWNMLNEYSEMLYSANYSLLLSHNLT